MLIIPSFPRGRQFPPPSYGSVFVFVACIVVMEEFEFAAALLEKF